MKRVTATVIVGLGLLASPASAGANSARAEVLGLNGLLVEAPSGDNGKHRIRLTYGSAGYTVFDGSGIVAGLGCVQAFQKSVTCADAAIFSVKVTTRGGDDGINLISIGPGARSTVLPGGGDDSVRGSAGRDRLTGGAGDDQIAGGAGDDFLKGGSGADRLSGGDGTDSMLGDSGIDRLFARDGGRDATLACGGGDDRRERALVDAKDRAPRSC